MWIFTTVGFFSVVNNSQGGGLLVRARVKGDLDALRKQYMTDLGPTTHSKDRDYPYRAQISHDGYGAGLQRIAQDIDYTNFKSEVARVQGWPRERLYAKVWGVMYAAEEKIAADKQTFHLPFEKVKDEKPTGKAKRKK